MFVPTSRDRLSAASALISDSTTRLIEQKKQWEAIDRSSSALSELFDENDVTRSEQHTTKISAKANLEVAEYNEEQQQHDQQTSLFKDISDAGKKQIETMAIIAASQEILVKETLENSKIQKTFLYLAGLSTFLALLALFK